LLIETTVDAAACTDGWTYSPHSGNCYKVFSERVMWTQAEINCVYAGGHQASVHSRENNKFLTELAAHEQEIVWLGLAQFGNRREYEWADRSSTDYTSWESGTTPSFKPGSKCTKLQTNGYWVQSCCKILSGYICEKTGNQIMTL